MTNKELMHRIVNVTKNKIILEEYSKEDSIFPMQMDLINSFIISMNFNENKKGYKKYNSQCFEYSNEDNELILEYLMYFII